MARVADVMAERQLAFAKALFAVAGAFTMFWLLPVIHPHRAHDAGFYAVDAFLIAVTGGVPAWLGLVRLARRRRLGIARRARSDATVQWHLADKMLVANDSGVASPALSFTPSRAMRRILTSVPRATVVN